MRSQRLLALCLQRLASGAHPFFPEIPLSTARIGLSLILREKPMKKLLPLFVAVFAGLVLLLASCATTATTAPTKNDKAIADDLNQRVKASGLKNVDVKTTSRGVTITAGALNFPADSAQITADTAKRLDAIGNLLKGYSGKKMLIEGHTADVGDKASQLTLSKKRAQAVADYLVKKGVVKGSQLVIEGKGGTVPLAGNDTDEGRAKNRRVEITLLH